MRFANCGEVEYHAAGPRLTRPDMADPESSFDLLQRAQRGEKAALDALLREYIPRLRRWAAGRLPRWARDANDTDDIVQETVLRTLKVIDDFQPRHEGALQAYLRQAILNRIRDEIRRAGRRPGREPLGDLSLDRAASPLEEAIGREAVERYEMALARLTPDEREAIIARVELGFSYQQVASAIGRPSADAARMAVSRALLHLAEEMRRGA